MKKYIAVLLAVMMMFTMAGCSSSSKSTKENDTSDKSSTQEAVKDSKLKIGFILPAESDAPDTTSREEAVRKMQTACGIDDSQIFFAENVSKEKCPDQIDSLADKGCQIIFALGARYEDPVLEKAAQYDDIQFCLEGGKDSINSNLANVHTFNSKIYQAYYVAGVAAGMRLNYMLNDGKVSSYDCRVGFVAYKKCAETSTCINAFYLGIRQVCSQATISVRYVGKRGDYDKDGEAAKQLAASGVCLMCTYTFTSAAAAVCAEEGIHIVGNEGNVINTAPTMAITSTYTDWSVYYEEAVNDMLSGTSIDKDWCGGYKEGVVRLTQLNDVHLVDGTAEKVAEVEKNIRAGKEKIFNTEKFAIGGESLSNLVSNNSEYKKYKQYVKDGAFKEQSQSSAPAFDILIDGVSVSTENYITEDTSDSSEESTTESNN